MNRVKVLVVAICLGAITVCWCVPVQAQENVYDVQKELNKYGNLNQADVDKNFCVHQPVHAVSCGPTAATNSFVYLQKKYPSVYDNNLIISAAGVDLNGDGKVDFYDDEVATGVALCGPNYMRTMDPGGTWARDFIWGKKNWIENYAPGSTIYHGQTHPLGAYDPINNPGGWTTERPKPGWINQVWPQWRFMYNELVACEDVEILLNWYDGGHFLTLSSFHFTDANFDGIMQAGEGAWIDFIDPCSGAVGNANVWNVQDGSGNWYIKTSYVTGQESWVFMAVAESPVPEPCSLLVLATGLAGLIGLRRKR